ncbi:peroxisomal carnitine O-octanoyltransferase [Thrips palmi]|uniref:Peroxisomal carnitine O-octanoyltransferase n=1 Tax=Thrips palmi TaxID=161013 RepID=A0A6P8YDY3_THRPL|nr:peroxisomal carnitine O-octanoyltransferase [Thrips palmi]XP_034234591.1 peroxisomal carnitine O-octanoyltransferase [Thrips palmi]
MSIAGAMRLSPEDPLRTFSEDEKLPPLPLPSLRHTLERYVDSVRPFVSDAEFANTQEIVKKFEKGEGKLLQEKLEAKAKIEKNWVDKWWLEKAYLENRWALVPFCSMSGVSDLSRVWTFKPGYMLKYASLYLYYTVEMWTLLRSERLAPNRSADGKTFFSMTQWRRLFNCCRIPLPGRDRLDTHFKTEKEGTCPSHVMVACNGHIFLVDAVDETTGSILNPLEWESQLQRIVDEASKTPGQGIARLTCDDRDTWAKNNAHLRQISGENAHYLHLIESAMFLLTLEPDFEPNTPSEVIMRSLTGDYNNLWVDKSLHIAFFGNGQSGGLAEHTAFDGMISVTNSFYTYQCIIENKGVWTGPKTIRELSPPRELNFILNSSMKEELQQATLRQNITRQKVIVIREKFTGFGKSLLVKKRIHPDTFVQMALQLTYYRLHKKFAPCYETATTRAFYNGRTETLRVCTKELAKWAQAMLSSTPIEEKVRLLQIAVKRHDDLMKEAREANGCDRHLFGLYCVAEENKMPIPELFRDASYAKSGGGGNFILSTSLVGYTPVGGGVVPMCLDGYGIFYNMDSDSIYLTISVMRDSAETSASKYFNHLCESFYTIRDLIEFARGEKPKANL